MKKIYLALAILSAAALFTACGNESVSDAPADYNPETKVAVADAGNENSDEKSSDKNDAETTASAESDAIKAEDTGLEFEFDKSGKATVIGVKEGVTEVVIPQTVYYVPQADEYLPEGEFEIVAVNRLRGADQVTSITMTGSYDAFNFAREAFSSLYNLKSVTFAEGIPMIPDSVCWGCTALETVIINEGPKTIGSQAFYGCTSLKEINIPESVTKIDNEAFIECSGLERVTGMQGLKIIEQGAFNNCKSLKEVQFGNELTTIKDYAFCMTENLDNVVFTESIEEIGDSAFWGSGLTEADLSNVHNIGSGAFGGCPNLKEIRLYSEVFLPKTFFYGCDSMEKVYYSGTQYTDALFNLDVPGVQVIRE